jgi:nucleoside-diphosphate-sugar epimerase
MDVSRLTAMGWTARTSFDQALARTYRDYQENLTQAA